MADARHPSQASAWAPETLETSRSAAKRGPLEALTTRGDGTAAMTMACAAGPADERTHDAVLTVALNECVVERLKEGKRVTELAADRMVSTAERMGIQRPRSLRLLGFRIEGKFIEPLPRAAYRQALKRVIDTRNARRAIELAALFQRRSADDA